MHGMDARTGKPLKINDIRHLRQSIRDILTTPIGTRVMNRGYGSRLFALLDAPMNAHLIAELRAAVVETLDSFEPRLKVSRVDIRVAKDKPGAIAMTLEGYYIPTNQYITLDEIEFQ